MVQPQEEIQQAEQTAQQQTREQLAGQPLADIMVQARQHQDAYAQVLNTGFEQQGWVSMAYFAEMLQHAYPNVTDENRHALARDIEQLITNRFGEPNTTIQQSDVNAASTRSETAIQMIAEQLTNGQIMDLEQQARQNIEPDHFPENFDDHKAEWLAEWAARGLIAFPAHKSNDIAA